MVHSWMGGVKYQFTARKPATAATSAVGTVPPVAETTTTNSRYSTITVGSPTSSRTRVRIQVNTGQPDAGETTRSIDGAVPTPVRPPAGQRHLRW